MIPQGRRDYILQLLNEKPLVTVTELAEAFSLSEVSVRKLLTAMEKEGLLTRSWGGATRAENALHEYSHVEKEKLHLEEKKAIARFCYGEISDGESVFLDSGTTTIQLARLIASGAKRHILIVTNALNIAMDFVHAEDIGVIVIGGEMRHRIVCCTGELTMDALNNFCFDRAFVTGNHFGLERGFTTPLLSEAKMKGKLLEVSKHSYVVMDSSKYGGNSLCCIAPIDAASMIVTDWRLPASILAHFEEKNIAVAAAPKVEN